MKYKKIYDRLRRIEGQLRGVEDMITNERSEGSIFVQLEAIKAAVSGAIVALIEESAVKNEKGELVINADQAEYDLKMIRKN